MLTRFIAIIEEKIIKNLKISIVGERSVLKFRLLYKNIVISEDFLMISSLNFENPAKNKEKIH